MGAGLNIVNLVSNVPVTFWLFMLTGHKLLDNTISLLHGLHSILSDYQLGSHAKNLYDFTMLLLQHALME